MEFRPATEQDFDAVMKIIENGRAALAELGIDQWQGGSPNEAMIREDIALGRSMVAVERDADGTEHLMGTLAFVCGDADYDRILAGAWLTDSANKPEDGAVTYAALHRVAVAANARRRGVASFMIAASCSLAAKRGLASVRADTHAGNIPMQTTFERAGMTRCCEIDLSTELEPTKHRIGYELVLQPCPTA